MQVWDFEKNYSILNKAQKEVVNHIYWPVMVVAWPGTWKTQIIWMRTANMIKNKNIAPENILITTFTEAGVVAIKKRLSKFIWTDAYKVKVATIHSFSQDIITSNPEKFFEFKALNTIDDIESLQALTKILDKNIKNNNIEYLFTPFDRYMYLRDIKDRINKLKSEWITPESFKIIIENQRKEYDKLLEELELNKRIRNLEKRRKKDRETYKKHIWKLTELNFIYKKYQNYLKENSLYDFADMINFVVFVLEKDEDLKADLAERYQFIMLDEYQDTNNSQNKVINLILSVWDDKNIMVVWDDDQSIYRFQWANIENMLDFSLSYKNTKFIVLENNYRSSQSILDISSNLIENNKDRLINRLDFLDKQLIAKWDVKNLEENNYFILEDDILEKLFVLNDIKKKDDKKTTFAIICRSNREVEDWTEFMQLQNLEVESKLKTNILNNKFINFILDFLMLVENPNFSDEKLLNILRTDIVDVENIDIITLSRILYKKNYSKSWFKLTLWDLMKNLDADFILKEKKDIDYKKGVLELNLENKFKNYDKLLEFINLILNLNKSLALYWISKLFQEILNKLWLIEYIETNWDFSDLEDIFTLFNKIKEYNEKNPNLSISQLIEYFELYKKYKIQIPRQILKKVNSNIEILTAHSSKWLEYDYVYLPWVYQWNWESKRIINKLKLPLWIVWEWLQFSNLTEKELKNIEKEITKQEDRRLFFVAITRAKKWLTLTRPAWKDNKPFIDSPFVLEAWIQAKLLTEKEEINNVSDTIKKQLLWKDNSLLKTNKEEINYILEFLENYKLSPTDLNTFLEDPKKFLKNVVFKYPFTQTEYTILGNVYHKVLEIATNAKIRWERVELWFMTEKFIELIKYQILTDEERKRLTKKWIEWLTWYYDYFINNTRTPLAVEYNFRSRDVMFDWIKITWKIDKVEKIWDSKNNITKDWQWSLFIEDVAVVDYKTWVVRTENKIKGIDKYWNKKDDFKEWKYYRQLLFYKLLAESDPEFRSKYNIVELALDFVEWRNWKYKYLQISIDKNDYEDFKELVRDSWQKINSLDFWKDVLS